MPHTATQHAYPADQGKRDSPRIAGTPKSGEQLHFGVEGKGLQDLNSLTLSY